MGTSTANDLVPLPADWWCLPPEELLRCEITGQPECPSCGHCCKPCDFGRDGAACEEATRPFLCRAYPLGYLACPDLPGVEGVRARCALLRRLEGERDGQSRGSAPGTTKPSARGSGAGEPLRSRETHTAAM